MHSLDIREVSNMSVEGSLEGPGSAKGAREKGQGSSSETESIPEWSLNVETYKLLQKGHCTYNVDEQSLVWPPMLLMCFFADSPDKHLDDNLVRLRNTLAIQGVQANSIVETKYVCYEGHGSYHLFVLPPSGVSFAAAKAVDSERGLHSHVFYPSLKDMIDIKNGRIPEFSRRFDGGLKYHGRPRQAWINRAVDLVRDDGICVGRGVCQKDEVMDSVDEEPLGEFHVGIRVLEVLDDLLPSHWKGSLRRWRTTHVLYNGVSLFECLRQHMKDEFEDFYYMDGSESAPFAHAEGVLRDQSISSVAPSVGMCKDLNVNFDHLSATCSKTCRDAIDAIEKSTFKRDSEAPSLYDGESFIMKYESDEFVRQYDIETVINDASEERNLMEVLGTTDSFHLARDAVKRLKVLQKLTDPGCSSTTISSMIVGAEQRELSTLDSIQENVEREKQNRMAIAGFGSEIERFILRTRIEQHKKLLEEVANIKAKHVSTLEAFVLDKFKFVDDIGRRRKETEGIHEWLSHYTTKATDKEKKKWEEEVAEARLEEQKKWEDEVAKARKEEKKKCAEQVAKARVQEKKKREYEVAKARKEEMKKLEEQVAEARLEEQKKWEEEVAKARNEEQKKWEEEVAKARTEEQKKATKLMTELAGARQELSDQKEAIPICAICFEGFEGGTLAKCGKKRIRNDVVQRKRACFTPCMHSSICLDCAVRAWEMFKRCPVCSTPCSSKPQPIVM